MPAPTGNDRDRLDSFLEKTYALMDRLVATGRDNLDGVVLSSEALEFLRPAWDELRTQVPLQKAQEAVRAATSERLEWAGLYGSQLTLKLRIFDDLWDRFSSGGGGGILKRLLDAIDRLLDSILKATGLDEALKEFKDILRDCVQL